MNQLFTQDHVLLDVPAQTAEDVFRAVAEVAERVGVTADADGIFAGLVQREQEVTTGLMDGYAIPHTKCEAAVRAAMFYVRTTEPLSWETMDDTDVKHLFVLIAPASDQDNTHLMLLSTLATCLLEEEFKSAVAAAKTAQDVVSLVWAHLEKESE